MEGADVNSERARKTHAAQDRQETGSGQRGRREVCQVCSHGPSAANSGYRTQNIAVLTWHLKHASCRPASVRIVRHVKFHRFLSPRSHRPSRPTWSGLRVFAFFLAAIAWLQSSAMQHSKHSTGGHANRRTRSAENGVRGMSADQEACKLA